MQIIDIPVIENIKNDDTLLPEEYTYWKDRENRTFYIDYLIDENYNLMELGKIIIQMNMAERDIPKEQLKPIYIFIQTPGGDSGQSDVFCDILITSRIPIITVAMGIAMSAGFEILIAGHKRYAFRRSQTMVHAGYANIQGTQDQVDEAQKNNKRQMIETKNYILSRTNIDEKLYNRNKKKDWYICGDDLVKYHIVDKLINNIEEIFE